MNEDDFDELFTGGSPIKKFYDVMLHANRNVSEYELEKMLTRFLAIEALAEQNGIDEKTIKSYMYEHQSELEELRNSLFLDITANIVTQTE